MTANRRSGRSLFLVLLSVLALVPLLPSAADEPEKGPINVAKGSFPRRLLVVSVNNYAYANPVNAGSGERSMVKIVRHLASLVRVPDDQVTLLSDKGRLPRDLPAVPPIKEVIEHAITQYLDSSREQDRIILLFVGHAVEIKGEPYLMPLEGEADNKDTLISLDWLYRKMAACPAQQKVLMLDVCRFDPTRGAERGEVAVMGEKTDALLQKPPKGVQVLTACVAGQRSLEMSLKLTQDGLVDGGILLNQIAILSANGGIGGLVQKPDDPLPLKDLERKLSSSTSAMAKAFLKAQQTPRLSGEVGKNVPFDPKAEVPKGIMLKLPEKFKNGVASAEDLLAIFSRVAKVPPIKQADKGTPFSVSSLPPYSRDAIAAYKGDDKDTPFRVAVDHAIKALQKSDRDFTISDVFASLPEAQLKQEKRRIEALQKDKVGDAIFQLGKAAEEMEQMKDDRAKESKYWQAMYDFVLARLYARQAYILEYNTMLGKIRKDDLPPLDKQVNKGWRLASTAKMADKDGQELAAKARKVLETLAKESKGTPWEIVAGREARINLGLEWQPN